MCTDVILRVKIQKYDFYNIMDLNVGLVTESTCGKSLFRQRVR